MELNCYNSLQELLLLEDDVKALEEMYPQGEKVISYLYNLSTRSICFEVVLWFNLFPCVFTQAETTWAMTVLGYLAKLVLGVLG